MNVAPRIALDSSGHTVVSGRRVASSLSLSRPAARREFRSRLLAWYDAHKRDLPWRRSRDPYAIWVSEIMLQQTRVAAVIERYTAFMDRLPTVAAMAAAAEADVLALWSGLGYYRRARMMHQAAKVVATDYAGKMPDTAVLLQRLPGIGSYTSAAIASIGFGEAVAVVDGNVERVVMRLFGWGEEVAAPNGNRNSPTMHGPISRAGLDARIRQQAAKLLDHARPGDFNQAMMELGATVCLPRRPLCLQCPVYDYCRTRGEHITLPRGKARCEPIAYSLLRRSVAGGEQVLLEQRPASATVMTGMWELPSVEPASATLKRVVMTARHAIMQTNYQVTVVECEPHDLPPASGARQWFDAADLPRLPLTGLARKVLIRASIFPPSDK